MFAARCESDDIGSLYSCRSRNVELNDFWALDIHTKTQYTIPLTEEEAYSKKSSGKCNQFPVKDGEGMSIKKCIKLLLKD